MRTHPKKRFGQHFLRDTGILRRLERLIQPSSEDRIIEIGAGDGALSLSLAGRVGRLVAVEVDFDQIPLLQGKLASFPNATVVHGDILQLDLDSIMREMGLGHLRLLGNLPYNIATAIIHRALRCKSPIRDMVFMVQLEVAQRIIATPCSKAYGYLSVDCQYRAAVRMPFRVPPACFSPRPAVTSAVIVLKPRGIESNTRLDVAFDALVKAAFAHRRKKIANSFLQNPVFGPLSERLLSEAGDLGTRRAEEISVDEYEKLAHTFCRLFPNRHVTKPS